MFLQCVESERETSFGSVTRLGLGWLPSRAQEVCQAGEGGGWVGLHLPQQRVSGTHQYLILLTTERTSTKRSLSCGTLPTPATP